MTHEIVHGPSFAVVKVRLKPGDVVRAEAGAMVARDADVAMRVRLNASRRVGFLGRLWALLVAILRRAVGGETLFVNEFSTANASGGEVLLAPKLSGQIIHRRLQGERMLLWGGAFLACSGEVDLRLKWGGLRGLLSSEGLFYIEATGTGDLFFNSYGGIEAVEVRGEYVVDTGHVVAFDGDLDFTISSPGGGFLGLAASGEGLVCRFRGHGRVYIQSRNVAALVGWITPYLPS